MNVHNRLIVQLSITATKNFQFMPHWDAIKKRSEGQPDDDESRSNVINDSTLGEITSFQLSQFINGFRVILLLMQRVEKGFFLFLFRAINENGETIMGN